MLNDDKALLIDRAHEDQPGRYQPGRPDGRLHFGWIRTLMIVAVWLAFGTMFAREWKGDSQIWYRVFGVPVMSQPFADLGQIPAAVESMQHGFDPYLNNPYDIGKREFIYPRVWIYLFRALRITSRQVVAAGLAMALCYLLTVSWLVLRQQDILASIIIALSAFSCAGAFAVERGNTDILMLFLVVLAVELRSRGGVWLLVAATVMKVYPFFAVVSAAVVGRRKRVLALAILLGAVGIGAQYRDFTVRKNGDLPHGYGLKEIDVAMELAPPRVRAGFEAHWQYRALWRVSLITLAASGTIAGAIWGERRRWVPGRIGTYAFVLCGSIFAGSFLMTTSYDYRLIFLLPLVPMLVDRARRGPLRLPRVLAATALALVVFGVNRAVSGWVPFHLLTQLLKAASHLDLWALLWIVCFFLGMIFIARYRPGLDDHASVSTLEESPGEVASLSAGLRTQLHTALPGEPA